MNLAERFERKYTPEPMSGCWLWFGAVDRRGYGKMNVDGSTTVATHVSLRLAGRPLTRGQFALHRCDNPACVNPDHLFAGAQLQNIRDMDSKGRRKLGERTKSAHLTDAQAADILRLSEGGEKGRVLASRFGVSKMTISRIINRKTWRHVA